MSYPQDTIRRRVRRGVKLLDEFGPKNWRKRINLPTLDLSDGAACIIGQAIKFRRSDRTRAWPEDELFTDKFVKIAKKAGIKPEVDVWHEGGKDWTKAMVQYGFDADSNAACTSSEYYDRLTETWRRELASV